MLEIPGAAARPLAAVVLAGGSGTRLWPLSRSRRPKHLLALGAGRSTLLAQAVERVGGIADVVLVVTVAAQAEQVAEALADTVGPRPVVLPEPVARGTGPALGWAAHEAIQRLGDGAVMVSLHADHLIPDLDLARRVLAAAAQWAALADGLVAVGVVPTHPASGFGYIEVGLPVAGPVPGPGPEFAANRGLRFLEKPSRAEAAALLAAGSWTWNTGLFAWPAGRFLGELEQAAPEAARAIAAAVRVRDDRAAFAAAYGDLATSAVEPLVLERSARLVTVTAPIRWSDVGSFADLHGAALAAEGGDDDGNVTRGDAVVLDSRGTYVDARGGRLVVALGCEDLAIVDAGDALLVCPRERSQEVRRVVERLHADGRDSLL